MQHTQIRKGKIEDLPSVLELIRELAAYERAPEEVTNNLRELEEDAFGENPAFEFLVSCTGGRISGMAIYYSKYSTWKGRGIYLEDIVVSETYRNKGIGKKLFSAVVAEARSAGAKQLHWQVLDWNEPAILFYKKHNASFYPEWVNCKLNEDQIKNFSS